MNIDLAASDVSIVDNSNQNVIIIGEDKLRNNLRDYQDRLSSKPDWYTPLISAITIWSMIATADFKDTALCTKDTLLAIFIILGIISIGYTTYTLGKLVKYFFNKQTIDDLMSKIKGTGN